MLYRYAEQNYDKDTGPRKPRYPQEYIRKYRLLIRNILSSRISKKYTMLF